MFVRTFYTVCTVVLVGVYDWLILADSAVLVVQYGAILHHNVGMPME